jgi:hypothetical protein
VGQLARAGKIPSRQVGSRWYVEREALLTHKTEKDAMLRAVQAESVGLTRPEPKTNYVPVYTAPIKLDQPLMSYKKEEQPLFPEISEQVGLKAYREEAPIPLVEEPETSKIAIRVLQDKKIEAPIVARDVKIPSRKAVATPEKAIFSKLFGQLAFASMLILAVGLGTYKRDIIYSYFAAATHSLQTASVGSGAANSGNIIDTLLTKEIVYVRK